MKARPRKKRTPREQLLVARATVAAYRQALKAPAVEATPTAVAPPMLRAAGAPARFVQCWAVGRGYSGITQALDEDGQVWERVSVIENVAGTKTLKESWWEKLDMTRK